MTHAITMQRCNAFLDSHYANRERPALRVLEAGGGSFSHFLLPENALLHVLDIEHGQLLRNTHSTLRVQGDIHDLPLQNSSFDMIVCFNVIEHLDQPERALKEMIRVLAPGGILLLGCPERSSLKGLVTRFTPLWFHQWYYRRIVGKEDRGDGHYDAFATPFRSVVSGSALRKWLTEAGCRIDFFRAYDGGREYLITTGNLKTRIFGLPYRLIGGIGKLLSFGAWRPLDSDLMLVAIRTDIKLDQP